MTNHSKNEVKMAKYSTKKWVVTSMEAIPPSIFLPYIHHQLNNGDPICSVENGTRRILNPLDLSDTIMNFFLVNNRDDTEWILKNIESVETLGFQVYVNNSFLFIAVDGIESDLLKDHFLPLYIARKMLFHLFELIP